jgi:AraC-like DNA-binding protein
MEAGMTKGSRTQEALRLMREEGITAYAAAKRVGLTTTTVHSAWKKSQGICPCCRQPDDAIGQVQAMIDTLDACARDSEGAEQDLAKRTAYALRTITGEIKQKSPPR